MAAWIASLVRGDRCMRATWQGVWRAEKLLEEDSDGQPVLWYCRISVMQFQSHDLEQRRSLMQGPYTIVLLQYISILWQILNATKLFAEAIHKDPFLITYFGRDASALCQAFVTKQPHCKIFCCRLYPWRSPVPAKGSVRPFTFIVHAVGNSM